MFEGGIIPQCGDCGCGWAEFLELTQNIFNLAIYFAVFVFVLVIMYVGFVLLTSQGNPSKLTEARKIAISAVIGFVVVLGAFLIVDTIMKTFAQDENWGSIFEGGETECKVTEVDDFVPPEGGGGNGGVIVGGGGGGGTLSCSECGSVKDTGLPHKPPGQGCDLSKVNPSPAYCMLNQTFINKLKNLNSSFGADKWRINEMWPPTVRHSNDCHNRGTCIDGGPTDKSPESLAKFIKDTVAAGLYPVWEDGGLGGSLEACEELRAAIQSHGARDPAIQYDINVLPHFSVYNTGVGRTGCITGRR